MGLRIAKGFLTTLARQLTAFLGSHLPGRSAHWWQTHVLAQLSFPQQRQAETAGLTRLDQLDLAALLRITQRNWSELAQALTTDEQDALDRRHYRLWADAGAARCEQVADLAQARLSSLTTTHAARLNLLRDRRDATPEPHIRRMRDAQISAAGRDFEQRSEGLRGWRRPARGQAPSRNAGYTEQL